MKMDYKALLVTENNGAYDKKIVTLNTNDLPKNDLLVKVKYSSINYKDALSSSGNKGVTKHYPHVPGIDAVGTVIESASDKFALGSDVLITGYDLGMNTWGGFGEYISIPQSWAILLPKELSAKESMSFGTAGLTAALSVNYLTENGILPDNGKIVVSGATGGVGSIAVSILAKLGYDVTAISGKDEHLFLTQTLGAKEVISRNEFIESYNKKTLAKPLFAGSIDTVGGEILSGMLKASQYEGVVTCCGMVASAELNTSIFPFILRGVRLIGVDSVEISISKKEEIWKKLAKEWKPSNLEKIVKEISLHDLPETLDNVLDGKAKGRFILKHED
ncbi:YhdH/YhfP family quinone oxidoreductase [Dysgonomonas mossii]|mgnify:CR=1 FL=1|uniref:Acryloyl-CoA reductase n=2 Tax=Dysgonomonas mossii TaxID=163665 RepID=A0A4Y9IK37_9BACT|nr:MULTISPECIES: YhdH/YhfP family quinone oxidoreductase [Dysgonomonas]MBF0761832.1 YhdH/YhfP family quinone oxidoreductase [Dysgonomonas mossii]TFU88662.1 acryloyl-CoA reductase [Dysgonomonas mossii]